MDSRNSTDDDAYYYYTAYNSTNPLDDSRSGRRSPSTADGLPHIPQIDDDYRNPQRGSQVYSRTPSPPFDQDENLVQSDRRTSNQRLLSIVSNETIPEEQDLSALNPEVLRLPQPPQRTISRKPVPSALYSTYEVASQLDREEEPHTPGQIVPEPAPPRGWRFYGAFGTLCLVSFIIAVDSTIIGVALPTIAEDIGASAIEAFWCGTSFLLASTVVQPPVTSLSHIFGRKLALLTSLTVFTLGSIIAAVARRVSLMLAGRTLQGLGSGGILALTYVITTDLVSLRERGKWQGLISLNWAIGSILGPLVGGAIVGSSWPWIFWINLPFCALAYVAIPLTLRLQRTPGSVGKKLFKEFDWIGTVIFVGSLTSFLIPMSWGGIMYDWSDVRTVAPLVVGILGLIGFGFHMKFSYLYSRRDPLLRTSLFTSLTAVSAYFATVVHGMITWCASYYVPLYHEARGSSPLGAGIAILPFTATIAPGAVVVGLLIARTGKYRHFIWLGWALVPLGMGLMLLLESNTPTYKWILIYLTAGLGLGILYSAQAFASQASASNADLPFAASLYAFCRSLGQGIGVAVGGVTLQNEFKKEIERSAEFSKYADEWSQNVSALVQTLKRLPADMDAMKETIVEGYVKGLRTVWLVMCVLGVLALIVTVLGIKSKSLDREHETGQGLVEKKRPERYSEVPINEV